MEKLCTKCGQRLPEDAFFCPICGQEVPQAHKAQEEAAEVKTVAAERRQEPETIVEEKRQEPQKAQEEQLRVAGQAFKEAGEVLVKEAGQVLREAGTGFYEKCRTAIEESRAAQEAENADRSEKEKRREKRGKIIKWLNIAGTIIGIWLVIMLVTDGFALGVRSGHLSSFPDITVGEAFEKRFRNRDWSKDKVGDVSYVVFEGYDPKTKTDWIVLFEEHGHKFSVESITVDGTPMRSDFEISCLLEYIYTGNLDALQANEALDVLLGSIFLASLLS